MFQSDLGCCNSIYIVFLFLINSTQLIIFNWDALGGE